MTKPQNLVTLPYLSATATAEIQVGEEQVNVNVDPRSKHPTSAPLGPPWSTLVSLGSNFHPPWSRSNPATWSRTNHACYEPSFPHLLAHELVGSIPKYNCGHGWLCGMRACRVWYLARCHTGHSQGHHPPHSPASQWWPGGGY